MRTTSAMLASFLLTACAIEPELLEASPDTAALAADASTAGGDFQISRAPGLTEPGGRLPTCASFCPKDSPIVTQRDDDGRYQRSLCTGDLEYIPCWDTTVGGALSAVDVPLVPISGVINYGDDGWVFGSGGGGVIGGDVPIPSGCRLQHISYNYLIGGSYSMLFATQGLAAAGHPARVLKSDWVGPSMWWDSDRTVTWDVQTDVGQPVRWEASSVGPTNRFRWVEAWRACPTSTILPSTAQHFVPSFPGASFINGRWTFPIANSGVELRRFVPQGCRISAASVRVERGADTHMTLSGIPENSSGVRGGLVASSITSGPGGGIETLTLTMPVMPPAENGDAFILVVIGSDANHSLIDGQLTVDCPLQ